MAASLAGCPVFEEVLVLIGAADQLSSQDIPS